MFSLIWRNLKPITISIFIQFTAPIILILLGYLVLLILSAIKIFPKNVTDYLVVRFFLFGFQWFPISIVYFLSGPVFGFLTIYYFLGRKRSLLLLVPLSFYILYFLPLILGTAFPPLYDKIKLGQPGNAIANRSLTETTRIDGFIGSALVLQNNILWRIDQNKVSKLTDNSYVYDFSKPLFISDNKRFVISSDSYSGSTIFNLEKNTKIKTVFGTVASAKVRPEVIGQKNGNLRFLVNLLDLSQTDIPTSTSSASFQQTSYLPLEKKIYISYSTYDTVNTQIFNGVFDSASKQVTKITNKDSIKLLNSQNSRPIIINNGMLVYGSLEKNNTVSDGIWSVTTDDKSPKLLYSPKDGAGIKAFAVDKDGTRMVVIKIKFPSDQGTLAFVDLKTSSEINIPTLNILARSPTAPADQFFTDVGWLVDDKIWIATNHRSYNYQQQDNNQKWDIWLMDTKGEKVTTVVTDADNYLFLD